MTRVQIPATAPISPKIPKQKNEKLCFYFFIQIEYELSSDGDDFEGSCLGLPFLSSRKPATIITTATTAIVTIRAIGGLSVELEDAVWEGAGVKSDVGDTVGNAEVDGEVLLEIVQALVRVNNRCWVVIWFGKAE